MITSPIGKMSQINAFDICIKKLGLKIIKTLIVLIIYSLYIITLWIVKICHRYIKQLKIYNFKTFASRLYLLK